jgi:hypothetical protein
MKRRSEATGRASTETTFIEVTLPLSLRDTGYNVPA